MKNKIKKNNSKYMDKTVSRSTSNGMKKFIYILVAIIITNFFLPFGLIITANLIQKSVAEATENCTIVSAKWNPAGERPSDFYDDGTTGGDKTQGNIIVKTKNCVGQTDINLTIYESDGLTSLTDNTWDKSGLDNRVISIPSDNFTINMELGEEDCEARKGINDCALYFNLKKGSVTIYESYQKSSGILYYECDDACLTNAELLMVIPNGSDDEPVNMDAINPTSTPNTYELLAPIGTFKFAPDNIGEYFNTIFMIAIGLCGALAVIMIVLGGIQYMGDESVFGKTEAKSKIFAAILGLLIALGSYALLNTINPDFLNGGVHIDQVSAEINAIEYISSKSFTQITGKKTLSASEYDIMGRKVAKEVGIPFCAIRVILERESRGNPGAIGFDENVRNSGIPSRVAFVNSGKKYSGETFTPSTDLIKKQGFVNQNKNSITNTPGLGVDWRFSKGLGLTQITLFPPEYNQPGYKTNPPGLEKKDRYPTLNGLTPRDLLDPEKNLKAGAQIWKQSWIACDKDIYGSWVGYGGGPGKCNTTNEFLKKEATTRTQYYNGCPAGDKQV